MSDIIILSITYFFILIIANYYNKFTEQSKIKHYFYTFLDSVIVSTLLLLTFLNGFIPSIGLFFLCIVLLMGVIYVRGFLTEMNLDDLNVVLETSRNTFLILSRTIVIFMISFTIFRFFSFYIQIGLSLLAVLIFSYLYKLTQYLITKISKLDFMSNPTGDSIIVIGKVLLVLGAIVSIVLFNLPRHRINHALNLNDNKTLYVFMDKNPYLNAHYDTSIQVINQDEFNEMDLTMFDTEPKDYMNLPVNYNRLYISYDNNEDVEYYGYYDLDEEVTVEVEYNNITQIETKRRYDGIRSTLKIRIDDIVYKFEHRSNDVLITDSSALKSELFNPEQRLTFYVGNQASDDSFIGFILDGDLLTYVTSPYNNYDNEEYDSYNVYTLEYKNVDIMTDFYHYFDFSYILFIMLSLCIPVSRNRKNPKNYNRRLQNI